MKIVIGSDDREHLFAELQHEDCVWADVIYDESRQDFVFTVYPLQSSLAVPYGEVLSGIAEAIAALRAKGYGVGPG